MRLPRLKPNLRPAARATCFVSVPLAVLVIAHFLAFFASATVGENNLANEDRGKYCGLENDDCETKEETFKEKVIRERKAKQLAQLAQNQEIQASIDRILEHCGDVCDTAKVGKKEGGKYYDVIEKDVDCRRIFQSPDLMEKPVSYGDPPARAVPNALKSNFTYNGRIKYSYLYKADQETVDNLVWTEEDVDNRIRSGDIKGSYGQGVVQEFRSYFQNRVDIRDQHVLVIGSQTPWVEALALEAGAKRVTTLEYGRILSQHPKIDTVTPEEISKLVLEGSSPFLYDAVISFSSIEHSGLGRYGDMLNPWGDLMTMARAWCLTKPGGHALIGVPTGPDEVIFNVGRVYGKILYSHLFANWEQIYTNIPKHKFESCEFCMSYQPLHLLRKKNG